MKNRKRRAPPSQDLDIVTIVEGAVVFACGEAGVVDGGALEWDFIDPDRRRIFGDQVLGALKAWNDGPVECLVVDAVQSGALVALRAIAGVPRRSAMQARVLAEMTAMIHQTHHAIVSPKRVVWRLPGDSIVSDAAAPLEARARRAQDRARRWAAIIASATNTHAHPMGAEEIAQLLYQIADPYRRLWSPVERLLARADLASGPRMVQRPANGAVIGKEATWRSSTR